MRKKAVRSATGAVLAVLCGFVLWKSALGPTLCNYSYDGLCLLGTRSATNNVTYIMMDSESFDELHQKRGEMWDRNLHAQLLNKLAVDNCAIVAMDIMLAKPGGPKSDHELVRAMGRHHEIVMRAGYRQRPNSSQIELIPPAEPFRIATGNNWGISHIEPDADGIVRRHWPFPSPGHYPSLAETAARTAGASIDGKQHERWLRYYGPQAPWRSISYALALKQPVNFFHGQIVFIGVQPNTLAPLNQAHKYFTPYSRLNWQCAPATDVVITEFLNLLNHESLRRSRQVDSLGLIIFGVTIGWLLPRLRFDRACFAGIGALFIVVGSAMTLTATTNFWFPWLLPVFGQIPMALVWALVSTWGLPMESRASESNAVQKEGAPKLPGYRVVEPAFGHGAYGTVWLAQNKSGAWRAVKVVSLENFDSDAAPYDREYEGVTRYREIADKHPGLLRVEFVSEKFPTHFYYIMELGDALDPHWEKAGGSYKPRDLNQVRLLAPRKRVSPQESVHIGIALSDTLDFLHRSGLTHRDIKPQNILFVNGQPKFVDVGLITQIRDADQERTMVGTPGYMPPAPEMPGTSQADVYALGMVLYVISTGCSPSVFPELPETLLGEDPTDFFLLNCVVLRACQPDPKERFASAGELRQALEQIRTKTKIASAQA